MADRSEGEAGEQLTENGHLPPHQQRVRSLQRPGQGFRQRLQEDAPKLDKAGQGSRPVTLPNPGGRPAEPPPSTTQVSELSPAAERVASSSQAGPSTSARTTIRDALAARGIVLRQYTPGQHNGNICPICKGGSNTEGSFNVKISPDSQSATWVCHRATCNFKGSCHLNYGQINMTGNCQHQHGGLPPYQV